MQFALIEAGRCDVDLTPRQSSHHGSLKERRKRARTCCQHVHVALPRP